MNAFRQLRRGIALLVALLLLLTGCADAADDSSGTEPEEALIVVGVSQTGAESDWRVANTESIKSTFTEERGYELLFDVAKQKQENQILAIRRFIQQEVDYIVLMPIQETGWDAVLQEARDAGIPVIIVDRNIQVEDETLYVGHIGSDFRQEGAYAVEWMEERYADAEQVNIIHVQGTLGSSAQLYRSEALETAAAEHDNWTILAQLDGDFTQAKAYEELCACLEEQPDVQVVYCENDNEAFGAIQALEEYGYTVGAGGVSVISFDGTHDALQSCLDGKIALEVECNPLLGPLVEEVIQQLEHGETPERETYTSERAFVQAELTQELIDSRAY